MDNLSRLSQVTKYVLRNDNSSSREEEGEREGEKRVLKNPGTNYVVTCKVIDRARLFGLHALIYFVFSFSCWRQGADWREVIEARIVSELYGIILQRIPRIFGKELCYGSTLDSLASLSCSVFAFCVILSYLNAEIVVSRHC